MKASYTAQTLPSMSCNSDMACESSPALNRDYDAALQYETPSSIVNGGSAFKKRPSLWMESRS